MAVISGEVKTRAAIASQRAATFLDYQLSSLTDPYPLSLAMYALSVSMGRGDVEHGYHSLMEQQRQNSGKAMKLVVFLVSLVLHKMWILLYIVNTYTLSMYLTGLVGRARARGVSGMDFESV